MAHATILRLTYNWTRFDDGRGDDEETTMRRQCYVFAVQRCGGDSSFWFEYSSFVRYFEFASDTDVERVYRNSILRHGTADGDRVFTWSQLNAVYGYAAVDRVSTSMFVGANTNGGGEGGNDDDTEAYGRVVVDTYPPADWTSSTVFVSEAVAYVLGSGVSPLTDAYTIGFYTWLCTWALPELRRVAAMNYCRIALESERVNAYPAYTHSGYAYVATTAAYRRRNLYTVGVTEDLRLRIRVLNGCRTADDAYELVYARPVFDCRWAENRLRKFLYTYRSSATGRWFYTFPNDRAVGTYVNTMLKPSATSPTSCMGTYDADPMVGVWAPTPKRTEAPTLHKTEDVSDDRHFYGRSVP